MIELYKTTWIFAKCDRFTCEIGINIEAPTKRAAVKKLRQAGWSVTGSRVYCPQCRDTRGAKLGQGKKG